MPPLLERAGLFQHKRDDDSPPLFEDEDANGWFGLSTKARYAVIVIAFAVVLLGSIAFFLYKRAKKRKLNEVRLQTEEADYASFSRQESDLKIPPPAQLPPL